MGSVFDESNQTAEFEVLDHWMLHQHFGVVHFHQAHSYLFPHGHTTDIPEHWAAFVEGSPTLHLQDEVDASEIHIVLPHVLSTLVQNAVRGEALWVFN